MDLNMFVRFVAFARPRYETSKLVTTDGVIPVSEANNLLSRLQFPSRYQVDAADYGTFQRGFASQLALQS
ncbi:hypothetical protein TGRH88_008020 [Toxoplasma gondii]|uniref:Uncharacterized protein n=1 Tax=Toxoplasma gondii TaxID=5811 RepID=A0A7J6KEW7_TOXGO|nr:hypothetical protein TGRH88_008020 [Toxoplasma gondii]